MQTDRKIICRWCRKELDYPDTGGLADQTCNCPEPHPNEYRFADVHWMGMCAGVPYDDPRWIDYHEYVMLDDTTDAPWVRSAHEAMDPFLLRCEEAATLEVNDQ